jgi:carboxypeptidase family protein
MRSTICRVTVCVLALAAHTAVAQQSATGGTIRGIVRDAASRPVAAADVVAKPGDRRTRTDTAGRFIFTDLGPDTYSIRARKLGFSPESWDVKLAKAGTVDISIVLEPRPAFLDTMTVSADRECPLLSIEAFLCRRHRPGGVYLDYDQIDDKDAMYVGEVFRDVRGIRVDFRIGTFGPVYSLRTEKVSGCINSLVDGRPVTAANPVPELTRNLVALEVYTHPDSLPAALERYAWPQGGLTRTGKCTVIVYWTNRGLGTWTKSPSELHRFPY